MKKFQLIIFLTSFLLLNSCSNRVKKQRSYVKLPKHLNFMGKCDSESLIELMKMKDKENQSFDIYWSDHAHQECPGALFPRMMISYPKVKNWVHVIEVDVEHPKSFKGWMWQLNAQKSPWIFLDLSKDKREARSPFYNGSNSLFHDNPLWGDIPEDHHKGSRTWTGYLYGLESDKLSKPVVAIKWGFKQYKGQSTPEPIRPTPADLKYWDMFKIYINQNNK